MSGLIEDINTLFVNVTNIKSQLNFMKKIITIDSTNEDIIKETELEFRPLNIKNGHLKIEG